MSAMDTSATPTTAPLGEKTEPGRFRNGTRRVAAAFTRVRPEVWVLVALSAVLNLWAIDQNGWANEYYSAAVKSMSGSWHNFLFNSFDQAGVMTLDKPPLAFWVQALSVRVFGFSSAAILIPQALMGVAAEALQGIPLLPDLVHPDRWLLWLGVLFILSVYFFPTGIVGRLRSDTQ